MQSQQRWCRKTKVTRLKNTTNIGDGQFQSFNRFNHSTIYFQFRFHYGQSNMDKNRAHSDALGQIDGCCDGLVNRVAQRSQSFIARPTVSNVVGQTFHISTLGKAPPTSVLCQETNVSNKRPRSTASHHHPLSHAYQNVPVRNRPETIVPRFHGDEAPKQAGETMGCPQ